MIGRILIGLGIYALAYAVYGAASSGAFAGLAIIIITIPYGVIGLLGLLAGWLWTRGSRLGGPLAVLWLLVTGAWVAYELVEDWVPRLSSLGDPNTSYNWALLDVWVPVPLALGVLGVVILGLRMRDRAPALKTAEAGQDVRDAGTTW